MFAKIIAVAIVVALEIFVVVMIVLGMQASHSTSKDTCLRKIKMWAEENRNYNFKTRLPSIDNIETNDVSLIRINILLQIETEIYNTIYENLSL
jgi:hypothetical protein